MQELAVAAGITILLVSPKRPLNPIIRLRTCRFERLNRSGENVPSCITEYLALPCADLGVINLR